MRISFLCILIGVLGSPLHGAEPPVVLSAAPAEEWNARFRQNDGWVGGDGAYSVPLSDRKTLWLFSDTWVGSIRDGRRSDVKMVNNTIGIQKGNGRDAAVTFAIRKTDGKPRAMLAPPEGSGWFWIYAGIAHKGKVHVFLPRIEKSGGGAFGFKQIEQWFGTIANPDTDPTEWKVAYAKLPFAKFAKEASVSFGSALLKDGEWIYIYGYRQVRGKRSMLVARAPADRLADFDTWRFLADGQWKASAADARPVATGLATEFSVSYLPGLKKYAAVYTENGLGDRIVGRFADGPAGPWSEPVLFYTCPEMKADKKVFCYAAKAHPHLASENELIVTYCVNAFQLAPVLADARLYWPNFVRVKLK
ncbi:MAG TPA: DUF4185 domain-containing protein [Gemmataceae bacterium]